MFLTALTPCQFLFELGSARAHGCLLLSQAYVVSRSHMVTAPPSPPLCKGQYPAAQPPLRRLPLRRPYAKQRPDHRQCHQRKLHKRATRIAPLAVFVHMTSHMQYSAVLWPVGCRVANAVTLHSTQGQLVSCYHLS